MIGKKGKLALALSGGSVKGLAHIGFLEVLEENHIPIDVIVGTSMGALIGGLYSAGKLKEFKKEILKISKSQILSTILTAKLRKGNTDTTRLEKILKKYIPKTKTENLAINFTAIATNLNTGKEVFLDKGPLIKNILASVSIPGIFKPIKIKGMTLVDGGVIDPLPKEYASKKAEKVISVNAIPTKFKFKKESEIFDIISESVGIITNRLINLERKSNKNHLFIQMKTRGIGSFEFKNADKVINIGRKAAKKNIKKIIRLSKK
jgi:NTE family protein